jgi:PAS domain S-box-containing protein
MTEPLRILILEDNPADAELVQFELEEAGLVFTAKVVVTEGDFVRAIQELSPDCILSDYDLPRYNGALALAEARKRCPDTPFILVTGAIVEDRAIEILTQGAKDYVLKSRLEQRLVPAVRRALAEAEERRARKEAEEHVRAASLYSRTLIEASLDPLVTISPEGKVMDVNRATEEVTGVSRDQIIGTDFSDYFTEPDKARLGYEKVFSEGSVTDYPLSVRHITGRITEVLYNATTYLDKDGNVQGVFAAARDVTKLKMAEEEVLEAHKNLENQVAERTADLQKEIEQRYRVEQSLLRYSERIEILSYTASRLLASDKPQQVVEELCLKVMKFLDCDAFFNFLVDEAAGRLHLNACAGIPKETMRQIEWLDYDVAVCGCAGRDACRIVDENIPITPDVQMDLVKSFGIKAYACHPLTESNRVLGTLSFGTRSRTTFNEDDLTIMKAVADQVAVAMTRIRTEDALRESEGRFRALTETSSLAVGVSSSDGKFLYINKAYEKLFGYTLKDLNHLNASELWSNPEDRRKMIDAVRSKGFLKDYEAELKRKDGTPFWAMLSVNSVDYGGSQTIMASVCDITERKRVEEALLASEEKFRNLFENIEEMVTVYEVERDDKGQIVEWWLRDANRALLRAVGVSSIDEIRGKASSQIFGKVWSEVHLPAVQKAMDTGQVQVQEVCRPESGRHYITSVVRLDERTYLGTARDITARKQAEEALRASEEKYRNLFMNMTEEGRREK